MTVTRSMGVVLLILFTLAVCVAQTSTLTYQGKLTDGGAPASGTYLMQFSLFDAASGGSQVGSTIANNSVTVANGIFTVQLDFGSSSFNGSQRWLEIAVKKPAEPSFTTLGPRQPVTSAPYSVRSLNSTSADTANDSTELGGVAASQYVQTTDSRMTDARVPTPGSPDYVQNRTTQQALSNFNVSGDGTVGGTLAGNVVNAATQYNINGVRILSNAGTRNLFAGEGTGQANTGTDNTFIGWNAGFSNTTGATNTYVGLSAGRNVATGSNNSFFGFAAGGAALGSNASGSSNSFFGFRAGGANTSGIQNSFFGTSAGQQNTGSFNAFFGMDAGFNNASGRNSFFGWESGSANTNGFSNSFFGTEAGKLNTLASENSFFGDGAGRSTSTGDLNSFFGALAGQNNSTGTSSVYFGESSGRNSGGSFNTFIGQGSGLANTAGSNNTLLGRNTNVGSNSLSYATAIGSDATVSASNTIAIGRSSGADTVQIAGALNVTGAITGTASNATNAVTANNALNLGGTAAAQFVQTGDARLTDARNPLPNSPNYIQNTTSPQSASNFNVSGDGTAGGTLTGNVVNAATQFNIAGSRAFIIYDPNGFGTTDTFAGSLAGIQNTTGRFNSFFGCGAGQSNTDGIDNSFFGCGAGANVTSGIDNTFVGKNAGFAYTGSRNSIFGSFAGGNAGAGTVTDASLFGYRAGNANTGIFNSFFGSGSGEINTSGARNSFFGASAGARNGIGVENAFFGESAGAKNDSASTNSFFGRRAGAETVSGGANSFFGYQAGQNNTVGQWNTFVGVNGGSGNTNGAFNSTLGFSADVGPGTLTNATAIGALARVTTSNSIVLGSINGVNGGTSDTNVGIGTTSPDFRLKVEVPLTNAFRVQTDDFGGLMASFGGSGRFEVDAFGVPGGRFFIAEGGGGVGINTTNPAARLDVQGTVRIAIAVPNGIDAVCLTASRLIASCSSSIRYKNNIMSFTRGLDLVRQLRPISFDWKEGGKHDMGLVAEEVAKVEPLLVTHNDKGEIEGVKYDRVAVVAVNAIKELQNEIEVLKKSVAEQNAKINELTQRHSRRRTIRPPPRTSNRNRPLVGRR